MSEFKARDISFFLEGPVFYWISPEISYGGHLLEEHIQSVSPKKVLMSSSQDIAKTKFSFVRVFLTLSGNYICQAAFLQCYFVILSPCLLEIVSYYTKASQFHLLNPGLNMLLEFAFLYV